MTGSGLRRAALAAASATLLVVGTAGLVTESYPFRKETGPPAAIAAAVVAAPAPSPMSSTFALDRLVRACEIAIAAETRRDLDPETADAVVDACGRRAARITGLMPGWSYGWILAARVAGLHGDRAGVLRALASSRAAAPTQTWLAAARYGIAVEHEAAAPDAFRPVVDAEIRALAQSRAGTRVLAGRYARDAAFRDRVAAIVETLPAGAQRAFLGALRRALPAGGAS